MSLPIIWSPRATDDYAKLLARVEQDFGLEAALKLLDSMENLLSLITENPELFPYSKTKNIRKAIISKQTSLFYRIEEEYIQLLHFWDNRQNPDNLEDFTS